MDPLQGIRILAVDDSDDTREVMTALLGMNGAVVTAVGTAHAALEAFASDEFDVMICDISLPDMDGYSLMHEIRAREEIGRTTPAVAVTGYDSDAAVAAAEEAGYQRLMTKPVDFDDLMDTIARMAAGDL